MTWANCLIRPAKGRPALSEACSAGTNTMAANASLCMPGFPLSSVGPGFPGRQGALLGSGLRGGSLRGRLGVLGRIAGLAEAGLGAQARIPAPLTFGRRTLFVSQLPELGSGLCCGGAATAVGPRPPTRGPGPQAGPPAPRQPRGTPNSRPPRCAKSAAASVAMATARPGGAVAWRRSRRGRAVSGAGERWASPAAGLPRGLAPRRTAGRIPRLAPGGRVCAVPSSDTFLGPSPFSCPGPQSQPCGGLSAANQCFQAPNRLTEIA